MKIIAKNSLSISLWLLVAVTVINIFLLAIGQNGNTVVPPLFWGIPVHTCATFAACIIYYIVPGLFTGFLYALQFRESIPKPLRLKSSFIFAFVEILATYLWQFRHWRGPWENLSLYTYSFSSYLVTALLYIAATVILGLATNYLLYKSSTLYAKKA